MITVLLFIAVTAFGFIYIAQTEEIKRKIEEENPSIQAQDSGDKNATL
jgi:hypothetical protein